MSKDNRKQKENIPDSCPHCGYKLTPWQQVLLGVDRALMCKNCWYRIVLEVKIPDEEKNKSDNNHNEEN